jgi:REase_DpnII-MboI
MSGLLLSSTAAVLETTLAQVGNPSLWPDPESGFATRLFRAANVPLPAAFLRPFRSAGLQILRRTPDLAAFGYVISTASTSIQRDWTQAFGRLTGREAFPSDRNSFVHSPLELLGIAFGARECPGVTDDQRAWLTGTIQRGFVDRQFLGYIAQLSAACAEFKVSGDQSRPSPESARNPASQLETSELCFAAALAILFPDRLVLDMEVVEREVVANVLKAPIRARDGAEAAAVYVVLGRAIDRAVLGPNPNQDPVARVAVLCRRFQLFVDRLQHRQRQRSPFTVNDEYDVQDLMHAILRLHFDDVRPEEWTPSYAGNSSRIDFLLPRERTIVEVKMTRQGLGQRDVADELIIDIARYAKAPNVDSLICFVYDPQRRCPNPAALENDLTQRVGSLRVVAVVCPHGT